MKTSRKCLHHAHYMEKKLLNKIQINIIIIKKSIKKKKTRRLIEIIIFITTSIERNSTCTIYKSIQQIQHDEINAIYIFLLQYVLYRN